MKFLGVSALVLLALIVAALVLLSACQRSLMYFPRQDIIAPDIPGVEALRIETPDGESLVAWYSPPPERSEDNPYPPVFLFFDGNGGRPEAWPIRWRAIQDGGAGFLALYYRGYSGSTGKPTEEGLHIDARAGYDWLRAQGYREWDIVIHGLSLGSGVASKLATERPARALILEAPFTAAVDVASEAYPFLPARLIMADQFRSRDWIGDVHMPVLIAHGDADSVIPFQQGEALFALANEPKQFVRIAGGEHTTLTRDGLYDHIWPFLADHPPAWD
jgi:fermentation-respiration switch protein FrsA (DUF1100 family)